MVDPRIIDPKIYMVPCPATVVDRIEYKDGRVMVKVEYIDAADYHFLRGKTKWLWGDYQIGEMVHVHFTAKADRFGQRAYQPMLEEERVCYLQSQEEVWMVLD